VLRSNRLFNRRIRRLNRPDYIKPLSRIIRYILNAERTRDLFQRLVLPADQHVAVAFVLSPIISEVFDRVGNFVDIVAVNSEVEGDAERVCQRLDGVVRAGLFIMLLRLLSYDVPDIVWAFAAEDLNKSLSTGDALSIETNSIFAIGQLVFLAVSDQVQGIDDAFKGEP